MSAPKPEDRNLVTEIVIRVHVPEVREPFECNSVVHGPLIPGVAAQHAARGVEKIVADMRRIYGLEAAE